MRWLLHLAFLICVEIKKSAGAGPEGMTGNKFLIFPGTKWCGKNNIAGNFNDLGREKETDRCCREHDTCDGNKIGPLQTKYGLTNYGVTYRSFCPCDYQFYDCLKRVDTSTSQRVGVMFFNFIGMLCYYPVECMKKLRYRERNCLRPNTTMKGEYKFYNTPMF